MTDTKTSNSLGLIWAEFCTNFRLLNFVTYYIIIGVNILLAQCNPARFSLLCLLGLFYP